MNLSPAIDWHALFIPSLNLIEVFLRGSIIYLFLFALFRIMRRDAGTLGLPDLLVVVLIADASQNAMASEYKSIPEGMVLVATIFFWDYFLDWASYHSPRIARILRAPPLLLIKNGCIQKRNLRQEMITEDELMSSLREQGIEDIQTIKKSYMEENGKISVILRDSKSSSQQNKTSSDQAIG